MKRYRFLLFILMTGAFPAISSAIPQSQKDIIPDSMSVWNKADFVIKAKEEGRLGGKGGKVVRRRNNETLPAGVIMSSDAPVERDTVSEWRRVKVVKDSDFPLYLKDAERGDVEAMRLAAICYLTGTGVEKDLRQAWKWYGKSAELGNTESQYDLGTLYRDGIGIKQNFQESAYWFRKAASNGHSLAMVNIARQFAEGKGVLPDLRIAAENYWRAAERGVDEGAYQFAVMLRDGKGVKQDLPRALKYFEKAAENNYKDSAAEASKLRASGVKAPAATNRKGVSRATGVRKGAAVRQGSNRKKR